MTSHHNVHVIPVFVSSAQSTGEPTLEDGPHSIDFSSIAANQRPKDVRVVVNAPAGEEVTVEAPQLFVSCLDSRMFTTNTSFMVVI